MTNAFTNAATSIAQSAVKDAIAKLAEKYEFDADEAEQFLLGNGVQIKKEAIPRNALPWCGQVIEENCRALAYNSGLFTQCPQKRKDGAWCTKCAKQVVEHGTPNNGDVDQRKACGIMEYKVGKRTVVPYGDYMRRHKYERAEVEEAAEKYGLTIDPIQFECKKRGRPTTTTLHMTTPLQELPDPETEEQPKPEPKPEESKPKKETKKKDKKQAKPELEEGEVEEEPEEPKTKPDEPKTKPETKPEAKPELEDGELEEEDVAEDEEEETYTAEEIDKMTIADLRKLAESNGIATKENGKALKIKELQAVLKNHLIR